MKTNESNFLPVLAGSAAILLMALNVEAIVIAIFSIGLVAIFFNDIRKLPQLVLPAKRRLLPVPARAISMNARSLPAGAR